MHDLTPACCCWYLQPSASAHLRAQVRNGPRDACTYTCVLRFVFAAFCKCTPRGTGEERTLRCMHLTRVLLLVFAAFCKCTPPGTCGKTDPERIPAHTAASSRIPTHTRVYPRIYWRIYPRIPMPGAGTRHVPVLKLYCKQAQSRQEPKRGRSSTKVVLQANTIQPVAETWHFQH